MKISKVRRERGGSFTNYGIAVRGYAVFPVRLAISCRKVESGANAETGRGFTTGKHHVKIIYINQKGLADKR